MAKDTKIKLFIFLIFVIIAIVLATEVFNIVNNSFSAINHQKEQIDCRNINILESNYLNNKLMIEITSPMKNITKLTILTDNQEQKIIEIEPIYAGETKTITIPNITIREKYQIYAENCVENVIENEI